MGVHCTPTLIRLGLFYHHDGILKWSLPLCVCAPWPCPSDPYLYSTCTISLYLWKARKGSVFSGNEEVPGGGGGGGGRGEQGQSERWHGPLTLCNSDILIPRIREWVRLYPLAGFFLLRENDKNKSLKGVQQKVRLIKTSRQQQQRWIYFTITA